MYRVDVLKTPQRDIRKLPPDEIPGILKMIYALKHDPKPFCCEKLTGYNNAEAHFYLALCYESLVENELAEDEFRKTIELDKNNAEARYKLIYYLKRKGQFGEAIKQLRISAKIIEKQKGVKLNIKEEIKYLEQLKSIRK